LLKEATNNEGMRRVLNKVTGKHVIFLIGSIGEGKSTLLNALHGKTLKWEEVNGYDQVICEDQIAKIGTTSKSETFLPEIYNIGSKIMIGDCPGINDNRHMVIRLANIINIVRIFEKVRSSSILVVISLDNITANRG
jgi:putative ribosome biogenesis GTPase RsgA